MSRKHEALLAVRTTEWTAAHEAKLRDAIRQHPIIIEWLLDAQADSVEDHVTRVIDFDETPQATAVANAYAKGRTSLSMELMDMALRLAKQPASDEK